MNTPELPLPLVLVLPRVSSIPIAEPAPLPLMLTRRSFPVMSGTVTGIIFRTVPSTLQGLLSANAQLPSSQRVMLRPLIGSVYDTVRLAEPDLPVLAL